MAVQLAQTQGKDEQPADGTAHQEGMLPQEMKPQRRSQQVRSGKKTEGPEYPGFSAGQLEEVWGELA